MNFSNGIFFLLFHTLFKSFKLFLKNKSFNLKFKIQILVLKHQSLKIFHSTRTLMTHGFNHFKFTNKQMKSIHEFHQ